MDAALGGRGHDIESGPHGQCARRGRAARSPPTETGRPRCAFHPHRKRPQNLAGLAKNLRLGADGKYRWHWDPRFRAATRDLDKRQQRLEACARRLKLPTLPVRGGLSDVLSEEGAAPLLLCPVRHPPGFRLRSTRATGFGNRAGAGYANLSTRVRNALIAAISSQTTACGIS